MERGRGRRGAGSSDLSKQLIKANGLELPVCTFSAPIFQFIKNTLALFLVFCKHTCLQPLLKSYSPRLSIVKRIASGPASLKILSLS